MRVSILGKVEKKIGCNKNKIHISQRELKKSSHAIDYKRGSKEEKQNTISKFDF